MRVVPRRGAAVQVEGIAQVTRHRTGKGRRVALDIGEAAFVETRNVVLVTAFCHPRVLIAGFDDALIVVREFLRRASGTGKPPSHFRLTIYVPDDLEGGLTDVEERALIELGLRLGARTVSVLPQPRNVPVLPAP